jgi:hypothetical protein
MNEQSCIIRIFRCVEDESGRINLDGIVETPGNSEREAFHDRDGLWAILAGKARHSELPRHRRKGHRNTDQGGR